MTACHSLDLLVFQPRGVGYQCAIVRQNLTLLTGRCSAGGGALSSTAEAVAASLPRCGAG